MVTANRKPASDIRRKLDMMEELAADPLMVQLFLRMIPAQGVSADANNNAPPSPTSRPAKNGATGRGELLRAVETSLPEDASTFAIRDVVEALESNGYRIAAQDKPIAVGSALKRLVKRGTLKRLQVGRGVLFQRAK